MNTSDIYFRDTMVGWVVGSRFQPLLKDEPMVNNAMSSDRKSILTGFIIQTSDGGTSWQLHDVGRRIGGFEQIVLTKNLGVAFGNAGCVAKGDGGKRWIDILEKFRDQDTKEMPEATSAFFVDEKKGWITLTGAEIISTQDGGKSWQIIYGPTESQPNVNPDTLTEISFVDWRHGLALSRTLGGGKLFKTSDGGKTWAEIETDERFYAIAFENERGLLVSHKNLYFVSRRSKK